MVTFEVKFDCSKLQEIINPFIEATGTNPEVLLPKTFAKFDGSRFAIQEMWRNEMENFPKVSGKMLESIEERQNGEHDYSVYTKNKRIIEMNDGSPAVEYDMKQTHPYGKKSRVSKKGIPYLIINFRWRTPGKKAADGGEAEIAHTQAFSNVIPRKIYNTAVKGLEMSRLITEYGPFEKNARGEDIQRKEYEWIKGSRLSDDLAWDQRSKGMIKFKAHEYFTFRVISAKSPAGTWIYKRKATPGRNFMPTIIEKARQIVDERVTKGFEEDLRNLNININN